MILMMFYVTPWSSFIVLRVHWDSCIYGFIGFIKCRKIWPYFFKFFPIPPRRGSNYICIWQFELVSQLMLVFGFPSVFLLLFWIVAVAMDSLTFSCHMYLLLILCCITGILLSILKSLHWVIFTPSISD